MIFTRITIDPAVCTGKPCICGLRFPVARLLALMAAGETCEQILEAYPYIESGDIDEVFRYAASLAEDTAVRPRHIQPVSGDLIERARALVEGVEIDLDTALQDDEA